MKARMRTTQRARQRLKGHWAESVTVECICITAGMVIPMASIAVLHLIGISPDSVVHASDIRGGGWMYALVTAGFIVFDWLLISPFLLGRLAFYQHIAAGRQAPFYIVFRFFGRRYFTRCAGEYRCFYTVLSAFSYALPRRDCRRALRQSGMGAALFDRRRYIIAVPFAVFFFCRRNNRMRNTYDAETAAAYLLIESPDGSYPKRLFKASAAKMRGILSRPFSLSRASADGLPHACL